MIDLQVQGLVGPTHNFAGLSPGNRAAEQNAGAVARPRAAALQALDVAGRMLELGQPVLLLPPQERPLLGGAALPTGRALAELPLDVLARVSSSSSMWAANAATVGPAADTRDGRTHFVVANLVANPHRALEAPTTERCLRALFPDEARFVVHGGHAPTRALADEGAANHMRLVGHDGRAAHVFVYGRDGDEPLVHQGHVRRQTLQASRATARALGLDLGRCLFVRQSDAAIAAGVFHNDVAAASHGDFLLVHGQAWEEQAAVLGALVKLVPGLEIVEVQPGELPLAEAVRSYLFNAQLLAQRDETLTMIAPTECRDAPEARAVIDRLVATSRRLRRVLFLPLQESMKNGGGPACLRLRVPLGADDLARMGPRLLDASRLAALRAWVERHHRETLAPEDLRDPALLVESRAALESLGPILGIGPVHAFQLSP